MKKIIYLHGFLSSPLSLKAQQTIEYCQQHYADSIQIVAPQLLNYPNEVAQQLDALLADKQNILGFIGSSLGGYFATFLLFAVVERNHVDKMKRGLLVNVVGIIFLIVILYLI